jgi:CRISPR-associated endoribonuclease Cas6
VKNDLISLVLYLQPVEQVPAEKTLPGWWGRASHALLLDLVREKDPGLAEKLHDESVLRPFTASTLMGRFPQGRLDLERPYLLRLTALQREVAAILQEEAQTGRLAVGSTVELDYMQFRVVEPNLDPHPGEAGERGEEQGNPWAAETSYQELSAPYLLAKEAAPKRLSLQLTSPTTFKSAGKHIPIPLPELVFGSLLERWNAFAPIAFPPEVRRYAEECLAVTQYKLSSRAVPLSSSNLRVGAVGEVSYTTLNYDRYWMSVIATLAQFALFSGVGAGTSQGLGQCRRVG